jgi:conjugative transfer signal peptidase TraF
MTGRPLPIVLGLLALAAIAASAHDRPPLYIWNSSPSVPRGLYQLQPEGAVGITTLVAVRPPEPLATALALNGYLPLGVPMLKRVLALDGQTVCRDGHTVRIDGIDLQSTAKTRDARGRPLPSWQGCYRIAGDEVFLMNWQSDDSLDGRYFGSFPRSTIIAPAIPVWTDENGDGRFVWHAPTE